MFEGERAFDLINNLDLREAIRRFGPAYAIVVINPKLQIERVERFKVMPDSDEVHVLMSEYPTCAYFFTQPGMHHSIEKLRNKIASCSDAFKI